MNNKQIITIVIEKNNQEVRIGNVIQEWGDDIILNRMVRAGHDVKEICNLKKSERYVHIKACTSMYYSVSSIIIQNIQKVYNQMPISG